MVELEKSNKQNRYTLAVVGGAIFISIFLGFLIGRPLYQNIARSSQELKEKQLTLKKLENKLVALKQLESKKEELEKKNALVIAAIPDDKDLSRLFYQLEAIATSTGVRIDSVNESAPIKAVVTSSDNASRDTTQSTTLVSPISYTVKGKSTSYSDIRRFLDSIEGSLRILSVNNIKINENQGTLTVELKINTYKRGL
jgi:Tfp pilus assembly protein PilO